MKSQEYDHAPVCPSLNGDAEYVNIQSFKKELEIP